MVLSRRHILAIGPPQPKFSFKKYNKTLGKVQHGASLTLCMAQHQKAILAKGNWLCPPHRTTGQISAEELLPNGQSTPHPLWDSCKEILLGSMHAFETDGCCNPHPKLAGSCQWLLLLGHHPLVCQQGALDVFL